MRRVLITGGAGFVGSSLALRLRESYPAAEIVCVDNLYRKGSELNRARLEAGGVVFLKGDVRDRALFRMARCDLVIDAAAEPSVLAGETGRDVDYVVDTNLGGTLNVLEAVRHWGARLVFLSSSRVYPVEALGRIALEETERRFEAAVHQDLAGIGAAGISEGFCLDGSRTLYGATKFASEIMVREYAAQFGLETMVDRCGVLAGPWQMGRVDQGVVALWVAAHCFGRALTYIGYRGKQVRDVLHVQDLADLILAQIESPRPWRGDVYNVGGGREVSCSLLELTALCGQITGVSLSPTMLDEVRRGDIPWYITDTGKVAAAFTWRPRCSLAGIIEDTAKWVRDHRDLLRPVFDVGR